MAVTGWLLPTARTVDSGSGTWTNDVNILADDGSEATFSLTSKNITGAWLIGQSFDFDTAVPAGATIDAVEIRMEYRVNSTSGVAHPEMQAFVSGVAVGSVRSVSPEEPTTLTLNTFDITADRTWSRADLLDGTFDVRCRGRNGNSTNDPSYRYDYVAAQVTYTAGATDLVIADSAHSHSVDSVALTQVHQLAIADAAHSQVVDNVALTQVHVLTVADAGHSQAADNVVLQTSGSTDLVIQDSAHTHTADSLTLTQAHNLAVADAGHVHSVDSVALTQAHNLAVADAAHSQVVDNVALTQVHTLVIADSAHTQTAEQCQVNSATQLVIADAGHTHTADPLTLTQAHTLALADTGHAHLSQTLGLTQVHTLVIDGAAHTQTADNVDLGSSEEVDLVIASAQHQHTAQNIKLTTHLVPAPKVSARVSAAVHVPGVTHRVVQRSGAA